MEEDFNSLTGNNRNLRGRNLTSGKENEIQYYIGEK